jgi:hypothetical protein
MVHTTGPIGTPLRSAATTYHVQAWLVRVYVYVVVNKETCN